MYQVQEADRFVVVTPKDDIVASNADELRQLLVEKIEDSEGELVVDLQHVSVIDSSGLGVLIAAQNSLKDKGIQLKVVNVSEDIMGLFKIMRLDQHFQVEERTNA